MLVEELLELLVDVVDANLLEAVVVEDLEAGNVEDTNVGDLLHGWVAEGLVTLVDNNPEGKNLTCSQLATQCAILVRRRPSRPKDYCPGAEVF